MITVNSQFLQSNAGRAMHFTDIELFQHWSCSTLLSCLTHSGFDFCSCKREIKWCSTYNIMVSAVSLGHCPLNIHVWDCSKSLPNVKAPRFDEKTPRVYFLTLSSLLSKPFVEQLGFSNNTLGVLGKETSSHLWIRERKHSAASYHQISSQWITWLIKEIWGCF